jgi:RNA ligase (TIGR02306 family)
MSVASIQRVRDVRQHPNADALDLCTVLGWQVVVKKGEFKSGDLCVYIEIDSVLPDKPDFEFLRNKNFRIKPIKLRGEASNGICFPLSILSKFPVKVDHIYTEGDDVTEVLGITHYEKPIPAELSGKVVGHRPGFIRKTDELNLRSYPHVLDAMKGLPYYITRKDDGSSGTFFLKDGVFGVCSRNLQLQEDEKNGFWRMARKYDVENALRTSYLGQTENVAIQAEVVGPGVNGNNLGLKELELHVFNLIDLKKGVLESADHLFEFCLVYRIPTITLIEEGDSFGYELHELVSLANAQKYPNGSPAEGIVIRPKNYTPEHSERLAWDALSGKIINENYKDEA